MHVAALAVPSVVLHEHACFLSNSLPELLCLFPVISGLVSALFSAFALVVGVASASLGLVCS